MKLYDFIVSKRKPVRYYRHIAFWLLRYLFLVQMIFGSMYFFLGLKQTESIFIAFTSALYLVSLEMLFTYTIVYWLIPKFFKTQKFLFLAGLIFLSILLVISASPVYIPTYGLGSLPKYSFALIWECAASIAGYKWIGIKL